MKTGESLQQVRQDMSSWSDDTSILSGKP